MRFRSAVIGMMALPAVAFAQGGGTADPSCAGISADACQQAIDFFTYMAPQLGTAITGGNTTMGQGGTLGGRRLGLIPHFAVTVRANAVLGSVPDGFNPALQAPASTVPNQATTANPLPTKNIFVPAPAVDAAIGVFKGFPLALSNVGGVDILVSAMYVPTYKSDEINIEPDNNLSFGGGVRIGLLQESLLVPGVGVSYMIRKFPVTTLTTTQAGATATVSDLDISSNAWRLTASKSFLLFGLSAGVGGDTYKTAATLSANPTGGPTATTPKLESDISRMNYFGEVSMNLVVLKIIASGGMVSGGDIKTWNAYKDAADKSRMYGSVGVRFGL